MKLISAHFKNFRLLKDLSLDFSTDSDKPLTVIRAANETGKNQLRHTRKAKPVNVSEFMAKR